VSFAVVFFAAVLTADRSATADDASGQVWLINTRCAPRSGRLDWASESITYRRLQADRRWLPADGDELFLGGDRPVPTTIFIHGNRTSGSQAVSDGMRIYRRIQREVPERPFRLVIWSWPSERVRGGIRRDIRVKASQSDAQGYYLAECLRRVSPNVPVSLIGYSFGARVITSALHLLAGGQVAGRRLPDDVGRELPAPEQAPLRRAILVAAAVDADWLLPGRRNGLALSQVDRLLITKNGRDPVLRWYPLTCGRRGPEALGFAGLAGCWLDERIELLNVSCSVGRFHDWARYLTSMGLRRRLAWYTFLHAPQPANAPTLAAPEVSAQ